MYAYIIAWVIGISIYISLVLDGRSVHIKHKLPIMIPLVKFLKIKRRHSYQSYYKQLFTNISRL